MAEQTGSIERGRLIAENMMNRAEAKWRHEQGQPHIMAHCEHCADPSPLVDLYRELAARDRLIARGRADEG